MVDINLIINIDDAIRYFLINSTRPEIDGYFDEVTILLSFDAEKDLLLYFLELLKDEDSEAEYVIYKKLAEIQKITGC